MRPLLTPPNRWLPRSKNSKRIPMKRLPLRRDLVEVYAKLNYAVNTAYLGSEALNVLTEDELVAWPAEMPFATLEELDAAAEEEEQKALNADD